jgi:hypothetical protein
MGSIAVDQDYRPALSRRIERLRAWYTPERFRATWRVAKTITSLEGSTRPTTELVMDLSRSARAVYSWLAGEHVPDVLSLARIDKVFSKVIGDDWMTKVDTFLFNDGGGTNDV